MYSNAWNKREEHYIPSWLPSMKTILVLSSHVFCSTSYFNNYISTPMAIMQAQYLLEVALFCWGMNRETQIRNFKKLFQHIRHLFKKKIFFFYLFFLKTNLHVIPQSALKIPLLSKSICYLT